MLGIYDASSTSEELSLLAGKDVLKKYEIISSQSFASTFSYFLTEAKGRAVYIVRFQCNFQKEQGRRKNTRLAVHVGKPESPQELRKKTAELLQQKYRINGGIEGFLSVYSDNANQNIQDKANKMMKAVNKSGEVNIKVGSEKEAGMLTGVIHDYEFQSGAIYPVAVKHKSDGIDNIGILKNITGSKGVRIVIDKYGHEGVQFIESNSLFGKIKNLI